MRRAVWVLLICLGFVLGACNSRADVASPPVAATPPRAAAALLAPTAGIMPVRFPEDEAPHDMLTEWWYYTGHLFTADGRRYGFEYVIFQANRGAFPPVYAANFAITDNPAGTFQYAEKTAQNAVQPTDQGFALRLDDWSMTGALGTDRLRAAMPGYAIDLTAQATKPPALHNGNGFVNFGPAGGSYYYSRTRMNASGTLIVGNETLQVTGEAWMDHQWGNFISVGAGGWDWFSTQLDNGTELTISLIRDDAGGIAGAYGTLVGADGASQNLRQDEFVVTATGSWTSPTSGATYPSGWTIELPGRGWSLTLAPSMLDQELRTTASTGVIYWEGEVLVAGTIAGATVSGLGYVELTGYDRR